MEIKDMRGTLLYKDPSNQDLDNSNDPEVGIVWEAPQVEVALLQDAISERTPSH